MRFLLAVLLLLSFAVSQAQSADNTHSATSVKGDVLYWEGEELIVKEMSGREVRVHVSADTKIENAAGRLKTGDKIEATVTAEGHAQLIRLQLPDSGPAGGSPVLR